MERVGSGILDTSLAYTVSVLYCAAILVVHVLYQSDFIPVGLRDSNRPSSGLPE